MTSTWVSRTGSLLERAEKGVAPALV